MWLFFLLVGQILFPMYVRLERNHAGESHETCEKHAQVIFQRYIIWRHSYIMVLFVVLYNLAWLKKKIVLKTFYSMQNIIIDLL